MSFAPLALASPFGATIANIGDKVATASDLTTASSGQTTLCGPQSSPITATNSSTCSGSPLPRGQLPASGSVVATTTLTQDGSTTSAASSAGFGSCAVVSWANQTTTSDPMLARGQAITYDQAGPLSGSGAMGLSGHSAYAADIAGSANYSTSPFSLVAWFRTTTSGTILGDTNTPNDYNPTTWDKMIWVDPAGHVVFGVYDGRTVEAKTAGTYADGNWHFVAAWFTPGRGKRKGTISVSVDNSPPANASAASAQAYGGYWHLGWDNEVNRWPDPPADAYFSGALSDAAVLHIALSPRQVATLYRATAQSAWESDIAADTPADSWEMAAPEPYTGLAPQVSQPPCDFADLSVDNSTPERFAALSGQSLPAGQGPVPGSPDQVSVSVERDRTDTTAAYPYAAGLHLELPVSMVTATLPAPGFSATLAWAEAEVSI